MRKGRDIGRWWWPRRQKARPDPKEAKNPVQQRNDDNRVREARLFRAPQLQTVQQIDRHIHDAKALVIDANAMARSVLAQQLRSFGITHIRQALRTADARGLIEHQRYDIILCDDFTESDDGSGQDLLEELRREQLLPYESVFVMRTSEATYQRWTST
jgi:CheY-like chemotaxis protein